MNANIKIPPPFKTRLLTPWDLEGETPAGHQHIAVQEKRMGHLERNSQSPSLLKPPSNALLYNFRKRDWYHWIVQSYRPMRLQMPLNWAHPGLTPLGTNHPKETMWPRSCCRVVAEGEESCPPDPKIWQSKSPSELLEEWLPSRPPSLWPHCWECGLISPLLLPKQPRETTQLNQKGQCCEGPWMIPS